MSFRRRTAALAAARPRCKTENHVPSDAMRGKATGLDEAGAHEEGAIGHSIDVGCLSVCLSACHFLPCA
jgi:hypothetical protein